MTAATSSLEHHDHEPRHARQLVALTLCNWHDADPVACSRSLAKAGRGENTRRASLSSRETDALLLRLKNDETGVEALDGQPDDANVIALDRYQKMHSHAVWSRLNQGMAILAANAPAAHALLVGSFLRPSDPRVATCRAHALAVVDRPRGASASERLRSMLVDAIDELVGHADSVGFPTYVETQADEWRRLLATLAPSDSKTGKKMRGRWQDEDGSWRDHDAATLTLRALFAKELIHWGWTRVRIGELLGVSGQMVGQMVGPVQPEAVEPIWVDPVSGRAYRDVTGRFAQKSVSA